MNSEVPEAPAGATVFEAEGLDRSVKAERIFAMLIYPLTGVVALAGAGMLLVEALGAKTPSDYKMLGLYAALGALMVAGLFYIARQVSRTTRELAAQAARYKHRTLVLTSEYAELLTLALAEHECDYYTNMVQPVLRLPWEAIGAWRIKMVRYKGEKSVRCHVISVENGLPARFEGEIKMPAKHFRLNEGDVVEALNAHLRSPVEDSTRT